MPAHSSHRVASDRRASSAAGAPNRRRGGIETAVAIGNAACLRRALGDEPLRNCSIARQPPQVVGIAAPAPERRRWSVSLRGRHAFSASRSTRLLDTPFIEALDGRSALIDETTR
jgi:hypothetical protein